MITPPLKDLYLVQGYGQNLVGPGFYSNLGFPKDKHYGYDLRAPIGTPLYAISDGWVETEVSSSGSKNIYLWSYVEPKVLRRCGYLHCSQLPDNGMKVKRGEQIGLSGNTGKYTTGPHLHFDIRLYDELENGSKLVREYSNGYLGYIDPTPLLPKDIWYERGREFKLPVDDLYGLDPGDKGYSWHEWHKVNIWFFQNLKRLMTDREAKAFNYGRWSLREVQDPAMWDTWTKLTKPAWLQKLGSA